MSYCSKEIKIVNIKDMSIDDLEFTLASCEQSCNRYYQCDTVAYMQDNLESKV